VRNHAATPVEKNMYVLHSVKMLTTFMHMEKKGIPAMKVAISNNKDQFE